MLTYAFANTRVKAAIGVLTIHTFCFRFRPNGIQCRRISMAFDGGSSSIENFSLRQNSESQADHDANLSWHGGKGLQTNRSEAALPAWVNSTLNSLNRGLEQFKVAVSGSLSQLTVNSPWFLLVIMKSDYFQLALRDFLRDSNFFEKILMRDDLLTKALCGMAATSYLKFGLKGKRVHGYSLSSWNLRIRKLTSDKTALRKLLDLKKSGEASLVNYLVNMTAVLQQPGMPELLLHELTKGPAILDGLNPERMTGAFKTVKIRAAPEIRGHRVKTISIKVRKMTLKSKQEPTVVVENNWTTLLQEQMRNLPFSQDYLQASVNSINGVLKEMGSAAHGVVKGILFSVIDELASPSIILAPNFPTLLNVVLAPVKMDLWITAWGVPYASAGSHLQFDPFKERKQTGWGRGWRKSCPRLEA